LPPADMDIDRLLGFSNEFLTFCSTNYMFASADTYPGSTNIYSDLLPDSRSLQFNSFYPETD